MKKNILMLIASISLLFAQNEDVNKTQLLEKVNKRIDEFFSLKEKDENVTGWGNKGCSEECKALNGSKCDEIFKTKLRHGYKYNFFYKITNKSNYSLKIKKVNEKFKERKNFNGDKTVPIFKVSKELKNSNYIKPNHTIQIVKSTDNSKYSIKYHPSKRRKKYDDIVIKYTYNYTKLKDNKEQGYYIHTVCDLYKITWCGDGIKDDYIDSASKKHIYEECDPKDIKKEGWGQYGCSTTCKSMNRKPGDLALTLEVVNSKENYKLGDIVTYKIEIVNQGDINAKNIKIVDYIPTSMALIDKNNKWSKPLLNRKTYYQIDTLNKGEKKDIEIKLKILSTTKDKIDNWAEISSVKKLIDCDSTPDDNSKNDIFITDYSSITPNPNKCNKIGGDEDDHDKATISIGGSVKGV